MTDKTTATLGQIAYEERKKYYDSIRGESLNWTLSTWDNLAPHMKRAEEVSAHAVAEECAKIAETANDVQMLQDFGMQAGADLAGTNIAVQIRARAARPMAKE